MTTPITPVPTAPTVPEFPALGDPAFNTKAYAWGSAEPGVVTGIAALAQNAYGNATAANERAQAAAQSLSDVNDAKDVALGAIDSAKNSAVGTLNGLVLQGQDARDAAQLAQAAAEAVGNFRGRWSDLSGPLAPPASCAHDGSFWVLLSSVPDVALAEPGVSPAWQKGAEQWDLGDVRISAEPLAAPLWLRGGKVYLQSSYPELYALLGHRPTLPTLQSALGTTPDAVAVADRTIIVAKKDSTSARRWANRSSGSITLPTSKQWVMWGGGGRFVALASDNSAAIYSSNDGATWSTGTVPSGVTTPIRIAGGGLVFVAISTGATDVMARTTDGGATWSTITLPSSISRSLLAGDGTYFCTGSGSAFAYSTDGGATWSERSDQARPLWAADGRVLAINENTQAVLYSTDAGATFTQVGWTQTGGPGASYGIAASAKLLVQADILVSGDVHYSSDMGVTWRRRQIVPNISPYDRVQFAVSDTLIVAVLSKLGGGSDPVMAYFDTRAYDETTQFYVPSFAEESYMKAQP